MIHLPLLKRYLLVNAIDLHVPLGNDPGLMEVAVLSHLPLGTFCYKPAKVEPTKKKAAADSTSTGKLTNMQLPRMTTK